MNSARIAVRYAKALFDLALDSNVVDGVYRDMKNISHLCSMEEVKQVISNPVIPLIKREEAVISLAGIVFSRSVRVGGDKMDVAVLQHIKRQYNLLIGERTAEQIKTSIGNAYPVGERETMLIKGRDLVSGIPKTVEINSDEIRESIQEQIDSIVETIKVALEQTPPELAADIVDRGIVLTGGGALLKGLDHLLRLETGLPIMLVEDPLTTVVLGSGKALEEIAILKQVLT